MLRLCAMEGLEAAIIDRSRHCSPRTQPRRQLGRPAARQLFVALIVTAATILAGRDSIAIPFSSTKITSEVILAVFNLTWTGFTVLWFMQILPKHLAAKNPDRYLRHARRSLFPLVHIVHTSGVAKAGRMDSRSSGAPDRLARRADS